MKKIFSFRYWIGAALCGLCFVSFVVYKQHGAAQKYQRHRAEYCSGLVVTAEQKKTCIEERSSAADYLPWWYGLIGWPEGITTWAIIGTGFAIAWQSWETRKSAKATRDAIILQHRPKIVVRELELSRDSSGNFEMELKIRNSGSNVAHVSDTQFKINWFRLGGPIETKVAVLKAVALKPGEICTLKMTAPEFYIRFEQLRIFMEQNTDEIQTTFLGCIGTISYTDGIGTRRDTSLNRVYDYRKHGFTVWNLEADYSD